MSARLKTLAELSAEFACELEAIIREHSDPAEAILRDVRAMAAGLDVETPDLSDVIPPQQPDPAAWPRSEV